MQSISGVRIMTICTEKSLQGVFGYTCVPTPPPCRVTYDYECLLVYMMLVYEYSHINITLVTILLILVKTICNALWRN